MFNWNVTTVINDANRIENVQDKRTSTPILRVKYISDFAKAGIKKLWKATAVAPVEGKVVITLSESGLSNAIKGLPAGTIMRLKMYARLSGSQNSYFANDFVFKGKPFYYEFKKEAKAADIVKLIKKINALYGESYLTPSASAEILTIKGNEYMLFTECDVEAYKYKADGTGYWEKLAGVGDTGKVDVTKNNTGFGTYMNVLKDLRLPTMENLRFGAMNEEEKPEIGAMYDQYTVEYENKVGVQGADHIGDVVTASTTHVFYVKQGAASDKFAEVAQAVVGTAPLDPKTGEPIEMAMETAQAKGK